MRMKVNIHWLRHRYSIEMKSTFFTSTSNTIVFHHALFRPILSIRIKKNHHFGNKKKSTHRVRCWLSKIHLFWLMLFGCAAHTYNTLTSHHACFPNKHNFYNQINFTLGHFYRRTNLCMLQRSRRYSTRFSFHNNNWYWSWTWPLPPQPHTG